MGLPLPEAIARASGTARPTRSVLVIDAHPRAGSLTAALADRYMVGALRSGAKVRALRLRELAFERDVLAERPQAQPLEPDLDHALALIRWADHLVFVFPTWWGTMPGLLKSFLDRIVLPGVWFHERDGHEGFEGRFHGKTADLITTMDTPPLVYRWIYGAPGVTALGQATLGFCGVRPARVRTFGPVNASTASERHEWLRRVENDGLRLAHDPLSPRHRLLDKARSWVAALRLQFHPMAWAAYALGALAFAGTWSAVGGAGFWLGLAMLFLLETATVFVNELVDVDSDRHNAHYGPFNGGARVLVEGRLSPRELKVGLGVCLGLLAVLGLIALGHFAADAWLLLVPLAVLALGYTLPPLKIGWRTLGELDVALTNGLAPVWLGWIAQGGAVLAAAPVALGLPVALGILPAITLSALPDREADAAVGKRTLAVAAGPAGAIRFAQASALAAAAAACVVWSGWLTASFAAVMLTLGVIAHAIALVVACERLRRQPGPARRLDRLILLALAYIPWFVATPLICSPFAH
ncbi:MAG TPA: NAD(P)H-dependent oxidoreductase [Nevskiaceae bacterium]|nr:NAD(P)H-dependent oxidoreductase [Nevskiaceae bacterium]